MQPNKSKEFSVNFLRELISYNPETGELTWKHRAEHWFKTTREYSRWNTRYANKPAFTTKNARGYLTGKIFKQFYQAHRVAFALYHGQWPSGTIDHIDGIKTNNKINNLRDISQAENQKNRAIPITNTSGVLGVSWQKARGKWRASIKVHGKTIHLGFFCDIGEAIAARESANIKYKFHANHGKR